jgi:ATP-dependent DNA helicase RecQ
VAPQVLAACVRVLAGWGWEERPVAVVGMPSRLRPQLTSSLARGIAEIGRLPYLGELSLEFGGPTGERGGNSAYRLAGVWDRFSVGPELAAAITAYPGGPVLLIDDLVDSRWTLTVAGRALRQAGVTQVLPLVLAQAG